MFKDYIKQQTASLVDNHKGLLEDAIISINLIRGSFKPFDFMSIMINLLAITILVLVWGFCVALYIGAVTMVGATVVFKYAREKLRKFIYGN
jgi:uncharacterized membrane protein